DHRRRDVLVAEQGLDRADVAAVFEQVGREGVAEAVTGGALRDAGGEDRAADGALQDGLVEVMAAELAGDAIAVEAGRGEDPLPGPIAAGGGELSRQGVGELDP